jgi:hypothetical protein
MRRLPLIAAVFLAASVLSALPAAAQQLPRTWQEEQNFGSGPTPFEPLMKFWYELDRMSDLVSIRPLTQTLLGREFTLVTIAKDPIATPQDALRSGKTIVLIANAVHGGETAGKEASQLVARDLVFGDLRGVLDSAIVLFIPLINPDGGEVRRRTNEEGFDMNRDYLKLESQEIYALVTQVLNEWTPDIHIDTHRGRFRMLGVPSHLCRSALADAAAWRQAQARRDAVASFEREVRLWFAAGFLRERWG